ncbi:MAG: lysophospholipase [Acutalibacteraceae bacterium]|jgi:alpha-beta hydrolase superfamily lysophospholipase
MEINQKEYSFGSTTGLADIYARSWAPADPEDVKAIFQIAHGMAEHCNRYEEFAQYLAAKGYAVFANDHIGHGKSVASDDDLGYFGERDGWLAFVNDAKLLTDIAREEYPDKPVIVFGHSMGSFIIRSYCEKFGNDIAGGIFCGTSGTNPMSGIAIKLADLVVRAKGSRHRSEFINKLAFGAYNKKIKNPRTVFDWLSRDEEQVDKYIADRYCGFLFTAAGYRDMFSVLHSVSSKNWYENVPEALPMLLIAGQMDPVGNYGTGVRQVYRDLRNIGHKYVGIKLYKDDRHEILNELDRETVYADIAEWADALI